MFQLQYSCPLETNYIFINERKLLKMKTFILDGKGYFGIVRPDDDDCRSHAGRAREAYDKLEAAMKDDETWREFLNSDADSRHNMAKLINDIAWGLAEMFIPREEEYSGSSCEDLRAEFEPHYENGAPF